MQDWDAQPGGEGGYRQVTYCLENGVRLLRVHYKDACDHVESRSGEGACTDPCRGDKGRFHVIHVHIKHCRHVKPVESDIEGRTGCRYRHQKSDD